MAAGRMGPGTQTMREIRPPVPNPLGPPTTLTLELIEQIAEKVEDHYFYDTACRLLDIPEATFDAWMRRGRDETDTICAHLVRRMGNAKARAEVTLQDNLKASTRAWQRYAWMLERFDRKKYGRTEHLDVAIYNKAAVLAEQYGLDRDELIAATQRAVLALPAGMPLQQADIVEVEREAAE